MQELIKFLEKYDVEFSIENGIVVANDIDLSYNKLTSLPESIGNIKCDSIDLSRNKLKSLPESIGNIKCNYIYLNTNNLKSLPESIGNIKCNFIYLSYNNLQSLPESFGNIKCSIIYLNNNKLKSVPESFGNITCDNIDLCYNNLKSLPESTSNIKCNNIDLHNNKSVFNNQKHRCFKEIEITNEYIYCDTILTWYEKKKIINGHAVYIGYNKNIVVADKANKTFAHGKSVRQCMSDILFKKSDRDTSKYKNIDRELKRSVNELTVMYRTITGACSVGTEAFINSKVNKEMYSINEIIELTSNNFGADTFKHFFN